MKFEETLQRCSVEEWSHEYMDYRLLKTKLRDFAERRQRFAELLNQQESDVFVGAPEFGTLLTMKSTDQFDNSDYFQYTDTVKGTLVEAADARLRLGVRERDEFSNLLEEEIQRAAKFYHKQIDQFRESIVQKQQQSLPDLGDHFLELTIFLVTNLITFRQALIRYDGFQRSFHGMPLAEWNLQDSLYAHDSSLSLELDQHLSDLVVDTLEQEGVTTLDLQGHLEYLATLLTTTSGRLARSVKGRVVLKDRILARLRFGLQKTYGLGMEPNYVTMMRGRHLKAELEAVADFRQTKKVPSSTSSRMLEDLEPTNRFPLFLNLLACFLYMMNAYIIEPSSAYYADALGSSDALSGIMIGAGPWFALISSIGYSFWTNYSYKAPTIFSGVLLLIGNLVYANAYSYSSMEMCLIGRAITGLGAPRIINRRYVADATPFSLRTVASAGFSLATALGAALGPAMAILLDFFDFEFKIPLLGSQYFNGMTGPGYFMALCWLFYLVAIVMTFQEPVRSGLDELKRREGQRVGITSSGNNEASPSTALVKDETDGTTVREQDDDDDDASFADSVSPMQSSGKVSNNGGQNENSGGLLHFCGCIRHITAAVVICMSLIFMKRIALESIIGSTSVVTKNRYAWSIRNVGTLHLVNGIIVIPVSALSGWLATFREDRYLAICTLSITLVGILLLIDVTDFGPQDTNELYNEGNPLAVGPGRYIAGSMIMYSGIEACESYVASLMSKVVPSALAVGTFNSGLLATLVGTGGRATGDAVITVMGLIDIGNLLNLLVIPGAVLVSLAIALIRYNYDILGV